MTVDNDLESLKRNSGVIRLYTSRLRFQRNGKEFKTKCPFHSENTASFTLYQSDGVWLYKCFGCGVSGNVMQFIAEIEHVSLKVAIDKVRQELGSSWRSQTEPVEKYFAPIGNTQSFKTYPLSEYAAFEKALEGCQQARDWLWNERKISYDAAKKLRLGYRQKIPASSDKEAKTVLDKGWIVFPSIEGDRVVLLKYRSIASKAFSRQPGMETSLFNTETIDPVEDLYVTEGEYDCIVLEQAGFRAVSIPSASTEVTPRMKDQMMQAGRIILAGDSDSVGSKKMEKLWQEMQERTFLLRFPTGFNDANALWCNQPDLESFRSTINTLTTEALSQPMASVYSLAEAMLTSARTNLRDHPNRLRFPWPSVDKMAILLPGSVMSIMATNTKQGKTCFVMNITVDDAIKHDEIVLNYQCELSTDEMSNMVAAYLLKKNRNGLDRNDYQTASTLLSKRNVRYYVGRNPTLNTVGPVLDLIEAAIRRLGATIVVLDHIHFICRNEKNQTEAEANAMQRIKRMAQQYQVKFIVVGQPRKALQSARGKAVHVTDWKGSETGCSDADAIFNLHRNTVRGYDPANPPMDDYDPITTIHLLGARSKGDGATQATLMFHGALSTFREEISGPAPEPAKDEGIFDYST